VLSTQHLTNSSLNTASYLH